MHLLLILSCKFNEPSLKISVNIVYEYIIIDNLNIVNDISLKKLMDYDGTKYRIFSKFWIKSIITQFSYDIDLFNYKLSISYNKFIEYFNQ